MPTAGYFFGLDFDGDSDTVRDANRIARFLGTNAYELAENLSRRMRDRPSVVITRGRDRTMELSPPRAGSMRVALDNADRYLSQENTASPIYGKMIPGVFGQCRAEYPSGTWYDLFTGYVDIPDENPYRSQRVVQVALLDGLAKLKAVKVSTAMYTSITTDVAIGHVLDAAGWPAAKRTLSTGKTTLARWWADGIDAFTAIRDLVQSEGPGALFYIDGAGNLVFEDRHYRLLTARSTTSNATVRGTGTEPLYKQFSYVGGLRGIVNSITVQVRSYTVAALGSIWTGPTPLSFAPSEVKTYVVSTTADGFEDAVAPTSGAGDFTVTTGSIASATLSRTSGKTAVLTITAGAAGATITGLRVRAETVTIATQAVSNTSDTSTSQTKYGLRTLPDEFLPKWVPTVADAQDFCNAVVARYQEKVPQVTFSLTNGNADALTQALSRRPSDRIKVIEADSGLNSDFIVEAVEHRIRPPNQETLFFCEQANPQSVWVLGDANLGVLGTTTRLGF